MSLADSRATMLAAILPPATDRWIALFDGDPAGAGTEIDLADYERQAHQNWLTTDGGTYSTRANVGAITFGPMGEVGVASYWAIFDEEVGGELLRRGTLRETSGGEAVEVPIGSGDDVEIPSGGLVVRISEV